MPPSRPPSGTTERNSNTPRGPPDPIRSTTNKMGQFRFTGIQQGRYTIEVKAAGFKDKTIEKIPAGTENVTVTLKRSG